MKDATFQFLVSPEGRIKIASLEAGADFLK
jgi:hypothetical protein